MTLRALPRTELISAAQHCAPFGLAAAARPATLLLKASPIDTPYQIGKFTVSTFARRDDSGRYCPSLSIRSGRGSMTRDRVFRFIPTFDSPGEATRFADTQARAWLVEGPDMTSPT